MAHKAEVIEVRQVSDQHLAILARCCGDEMTDSWHTLSDLENLEKAAALGHTITKGHFIPGHCPHCNRGKHGTNTLSPE